MQYENLRRQSWSAEWRNREYSMFRSGAWLGLQGNTEYPPLAEMNHTAEGRGRSLATAVTNRNDK
ncbi:MAG: hypothetical protein ACI8W8_000524 [Rhodothermales bacterium]|jgi:hypothetical protein